MRSFQEFLDLLDGAAVYQQSPTAPAALTPHQHILRQIGILVLGELEGTRTISCFSQVCSKPFEIKSIDRYRIENLMQDCGADVKHHVYTGKDESPPAGMYKMQEIREAIAGEAASKQTSSKDRLGAGMWEVNGRLVLVGHRQIAIFNGHFEVSKVPELEGSIFDFTSGKTWFDDQQLSGFIDAARSPVWCQEVFEEARSLFDQWPNWKHKQNPELIAALVCCTWLQTTWEWRPLIHISAATNSGKTLFLQHTLEPMLAPLVIYTTKPSEAGIRSEVRNTAAPLIIDEFESDKHREAILTLFRTSSRGGSILRSSASGQSIKYSLKHIPWTAAIESGLKKAADQNRFILLEMTNMPKGAKRIAIPPKPALRLLGQKMLAVGMVNWQRTKDLAATIVEVAPKTIDVDTRLLESYSLPCAMLGAVLGLSATDTVGLLDNILKDRHLMGAVQSDEEGLLGAIYESIVQGERGERRSVSELLDEKGYFGTMDVPSVLRQGGLKRCQLVGGEPAIFFAPDTLKRQLLRDTEYKFMQIEQILARIPRAMRCQHRMGEHKPRGIMIPESSIQAVLADQSGMEDQVIEPPAAKEIF